MYDKQQVEFEHPAKGPHHCSECRHYLGGGRCQIVGGLVLAGDWCDKWESKMAKLTAAARHHIPTSKFGLPGSRKYPMPDKSHAANAKARATQMVHRGKLSSAAASRIRAKANRILGE